MTRLVQNVTNDNFADLGSKFIEIAGKGFVIARRKSHKGHTRFDPTPAQWQAWLAYFRGKGINRRFMEQRDYWTVPAEWPHLFDAEATVARDYVAGSQ